MNADPRVMLGAVPGALATDLARQRVRRVARHLPASSGGGFECHLGEPDRVDVAVRLEAADRVARGLVAVSAWVECDADGVTSGAFAGVGRAGGSPLGGWVPLAAHVRGAPLPVAVEALLRRCLAAVPDGAWPAWVGALPGRHGDVRLVVSGLTAGTLATYLAAVGVPSAVVRDGVGLARDVPPVSVGLDVGTVLGPEVGIEVSGTSPRRAARVAERLLRDRGRDPAPAAAITRWPGVTVVDRGRVVRRVNHLKVVLRPDAPPRQKVYLYYGSLGGAA